jgi:hypothetical protein
MDLVESMAIKQLAQDEKISLGEAYKRYEEVRSLVSFSQNVRG